MKPTSDTVFRKAIDDFMNPEMKSAIYWTFAEIANEVDPEMGECFDEHGNVIPHINVVIETYESIKNKKGLEEFLQKKIGAFRELNELDKNFDIGEGCTYPDEESFYKDLDYEYIISGLNQCWEKACQKE
tara:strand:- start:43 stop:432 length:390 start_codon:yes stop_codon:yes gene_type:complete